MEKRRSLTKSNTLSQESPRESRNTGDLSQPKKGNIYQDYSQHHPTWREKKRASMSILFHPIQYNTGNLRTIKQVKEIKGL